MKRNISVVVFLSVLILSFTGCQSSVSLFDNESPVASQPSSATTPPTSYGSYTSYSYPPVSGTTTNNPPMETNTEEKKPEVQSEAITTSSNITIDHFMFANGYECRFSVDYSAGNAVLSFDMPNMEFFSLHSYITQSMLLNTVAMRMLTGSDVVSDFGYSEIFIHGNYSPEQYKQFISDLKQTVLEYYGLDEEPSEDAVSETYFPEPGSDENSSNCVSEDLVEEILREFTLTVFDSELEIVIFHHDAILSYSGLITNEDKMLIVDYLSDTMPLYYTDILWEYTSLDELSSGIFIFDINEDFADLDVDLLVYEFADLLGKYLNTSVFFSDGMTEVHIAEAAEEIKTEETPVNTVPESAEPIENEAQLDETLPAVVQPVTERAEEPVARKVENAVKAAKKGINSWIIIPSVTGFFILAFFLILIRRKRRR